MKKVSLYLQAGFYAIGGIMHFINPAFYIGLMPEWLPYPVAANNVSGIAEILLAIGLLMPTSRRVAAWLIIAMLMVFLVVIHIPMAITFYQTSNPLTWLAMLRLPFQLLLIWWAYSFTKTTGKIS